MFKTAFVAAFVAVASAASWPMITVNSAGDLVLNAPAKAASFQLVPLTVTAGPTTGTTASLTTVTALDADTDAFVASIPSSLVSTGGFKLPTATIGRSITIFNDGSSLGAFTVWTASTAEFFNSGSSTTYSVASTTTQVTFTATDTTNWAVSSSAAGTAVSSTGVSTLTTISTAPSSTTTTLTAAEVISGQYTISALSAAHTATFPTSADIDTALGTSAAVGSTFSFTLSNTVTATAATDLSVTLAVGTGQSFVGSNVAVYPGSSRTFRFVRTAASTYSIYTQKLDIQTVTALTATATGASATAATGTCNGFKCTYTTGTTFAAASGTAGVPGTEQVHTLTNAYYTAGDAVQFAVTTVTPVTGRCLPGNTGGTASASGTLLVYCQTEATAAQTAAVYEISIVPN